MPDQVFLFSYVLDHSKLILTHLHVRNFDFKFMGTVIIHTGIDIGTYVSVQIPVVSKSISSGK